ncbi:MAG: molybdopterin-binding/glycosyltransferase family 2 protein [Limibacillus sp.]
MIFGAVATDEAEGTYLAHSLKQGKLSFKKGRLLSAEDLSALKAAGIESVIAARLEAGDLHEDLAAQSLAAALCGEGLTASAAFTGRCNLIAATRGLAVIERERLDAFNRVDEALTVATLTPYEMVEPRQMVATVKIIPLAVSKSSHDAALAALGNEPLVRIAPLRARQVGLVQTRLPEGKAALLDKGREVIDARLAQLDCPPALERRCGHAADEVAAALKELRSEGCELLLVSGASAIVDRRDEVPGGIVEAGGEIVHFGMPVDPGNLLLLADWEGLPVLGLPGCARSPKINGFDWVLRRLLCDLAVTPRDIMEMGAGGLLKETSARPLPRAAAVERSDSGSEAGGAAPRAPEVAVLLLAAGQSRRMGAVNKLLMSIDEKPMVRHAVEAALASKAEAIVVVTGHEAEAVRGALSDLPLTFAHNPDYASGIAASLRRGLAALPGQPDGVLVQLGDMPAVKAEVLDRLIAAFNPAEGRAICIPTFRGKRGNPVLIARRFFAELQTLQGDVGARHLISDYPEQVAEVAMPDGAVLLDLDTPEAAAAFSQEE